ncbi:MAG: Nif3-like dinuclear metal center hexameric protein [bacterium]|nr:Nif3-like dinuclear metal center hexameric protein [bacterium]
MNKYDLVKRIEDFAPLETQEPWDCSGWIVDTKQKEVNKILFALTITPNILEQALKQNCDMIISHHPLFTVPIKYSKINMYCAHTNFDKAIGGTTDLLLDAIHLKGKVYNDFTRIVELENEMSVEFLKLKLLPISPHLRYINNREQKTIKTIGFCAGSGSEFVEETPCDAFVTGDVKFHKAVEAEKIIFDIGHFESEIFAVEALKNISQVGTLGIIADEKSPFI